MMIIDILAEYVERTKRILELSSLEVANVNNDEDYRKFLLSSFEEIGELSKGNNKILDENFYPVVNKKGNLNKDEIKLLQDFSKLLVDATSMESVDLPLIQLQSERVLKEAKRQKNLRLKILALDALVLSSYMMLNLTLRLYPDYDICFKYRDIGLEAGYQILEYLDKDKFINLPDDECKELVIINSRYIRSLFEWGDKKNRKQINKNDINLMKRALEISEDEFYTKQLPNHPWLIHKFRTLQYLADFTEYNNRHNFDDKQLKEILSYTKEMINLIKKHKELESSCPKLEQDFFINRNLYLAKEIDKQTFQNKLIKIIKETSYEDYSPRMILVNLITPIEYILSLDPNNLSNKEIKNLNNIYETILNYVYHLPKTGALSFVLTFLTEILRNFIETPNGITLEDMCLRLMVAIHPPTYVHSISVARISKFLLEEVIKINPEYLVGCFETKNVDEVIKLKDEMLDYTYKSATLHDIGKICITETIMTYGRKLVSDELELLKVHPIISASILERIDSTKDYSLFAIGHHKWFNDEGGYPSKFKVSKCKNKALLSIMVVADCLDAATDSVGRSYKKGKTLDDYIDEIRSFSGTRYDPYIVGLFDNKEIYDGIKYLISEGRNENYREAYHILRSI